MLQGLSSFSFDQLCLNAASLVRSHWFRWAEQCFFSCFFSDRANVIEGLRRKKNSADSSIGRTTTTTHVLRKYDDDDQRWKEQSRRTTNGWQTHWTRFESRGDPSSILTKSRFSRFEGHDDNLSVPLMSEETNSIEQRIQALKKQLDIELKVSRQIKLVLRERRTLTLFSFWQRNECDRSKLVLKHF